MVPYAILLAFNVPTPLPEALSRVNVRVDGRSTRTSPGPGNPVSRQCPLESTRAGSVGAESGERTTEPEQLLSATVPAKVTAFAAGPALDADSCACCAGSAATTGAAPAPRSRAARNAPTRGLFMWGVPPVMPRAGDLPAFDMRMFA